jgi:hypothetical protein
VKDKSAQIVASRAKAGGKSLERGSGFGSISLSQSEQCVVVAASRFILSRSAGGEVKSENKFGGECPVCYHVTGAMSRMLRASVTAATGRLSWRLGGRKACSELSSPAVAGGDVRE